jgi:release factor glutamine methyltransferase
MLTLLEIIRRSENFLAGRGIERARREAEEVIAEILGLKRMDLYLQYDRPLESKELSQLRNAIQRRARYEPTAYISGKVAFGGLILEVNPSVLIPRQETEILLEKIIHTLEPLSLGDKHLWDVCCGSGCLGLAIKHRLSELNVTLSDLSNEALTVAQANSQKLGDAQQIFFKKGDLFEPFSGQKCDFFVCNPPYVKAQEFDHLFLEVRNWEPKMALVSGPTGLEFYIRIAKELKNFLNPGGRAWLEIGANQGEAIKQLFETEGWKCRYEQDWSGHDRFFFIEFF